MVASPLRHIAPEQPATARDLDLTE